MVEKVIKHSGGADREADAMRKKVLEAQNELPERDGKIYYVSENGDDNNDGLSPERPIKTYGHIQDLPLEEGDTVLLKRGDLFRISKRLNLISGVNYGAYGEGEKPKVYGSLRDYADASIWKQTEEKNVWSMELPVKERASITTFNNTGSLSLIALDKASFVSPGFVILTPLTPKLSASFTKSGLLPNNV